MLRVAVVVVGALAVSVSTPVTAAAGVASVWPGHGQAAYAIGEGPVHVGPRARTAPIASMAKVMTAYVVLAKRPVATGADGFMLTVTARDVRDRSMRLGRGESTVPVRAGERLTERQALAALLLPSANNVAIMLARKVYGSVRAFVRAMNAAARHLGMRHTTYTDPSGYEPSTRSTPADQVLLARAATRVPFLRAMVRRTAQRIPVAGTVRNTDALLGHEGFVGIKTGSMSQSGGCLMFRTRRVIGGHAVDVYGVVMGQFNKSGLLPAAFDAVRRFANRIAPQVASRSQWR